MVQLQEQLKELHSAGIQVVAVSYDSVEKLKEFAKRGSIEFPLLSDSDSKVIDAFGVRNKDVAADSFQNGVPHPGTFLIDKTGTIRAKLFYTVRKRHTADELLEAMSELSSASN